MCYVLGMKENMPRKQFDLSKSAYFISTDARTPDDLVMAIPNGGAKYFTLEEIQAYVGGLVEYVPTDRQGIVLIVNEEGLIHGLPLNPIASNMVRRKIVGNVLISTLRMLGEEED